VHHKVDSTDVPFAKIEKKNHLHIYAVYIHYMSIIETVSVVQCLACSPWVHQIMSSIPDRVKPKTIKLIFVASLLSTVLMSNNRDWLAWNQDSVSEWSDRSIHRLLFL
jgi:hypothetical protein